MNSWPLVLGHADASRILARNTTRIVLTTKVRLGDYEIHDAQIVRKNERLRKNGRFDLQQEPTIAHIAVRSVEEMILEDLNLRIVRAAGFKTQRDFFDEWLDRRGWIDPSVQVRVCEFVMGDPVRLMHKQSHRGYTSSPRDAVAGEPEAVSASDLARLTNAATQRYEREHGQEIRRRQKASLEARRKAAELRNDQMEAVRCTLQLAELRRSSEMAA